MRFAITAVDRYLGVFEAFVHAGWKPLKLFTMPLTNALENSQAVCAFADRHHATIQLSRMTERDMHELREQGCEALIVASYIWRVGDWRPFLKYAVNFHASPLPDGRGPYPAHRAIMENRDSWGVTCHRLTMDIDAGEILATEKFPLQPDECHESLDLKTQMAAKKLAARVAGQFVDLWDHAVPQGEGQYWPKTSIEERIIDFHKPVDSIMRHVRAFGSVESLANINDTWVVIRRAVGWTEAHNHTPGRTVHVYNRTIVVAAADGYIAFLEADLPRPEIVAELQKRTQATNPEGHTIHLSVKSS